MKKALNVCAWLALTICLVLLFTLAGENGSLRLEVKTALQKRDILQKQYNQEKSAWKDRQTALEEENGHLTDAVNALREESDALRFDLEKADREIQARAQTEKQTQDAFARERREWENQRAALTEEKDAVSNRLSEVLALLLPPVPAEEAPASENSLFEPADKPAFPENVPEAERLSPQE